MAGSFGHEKGHYDISMKMGEAALFPAVRDAGGSDHRRRRPSCRQQIVEARGAARIIRSRCSRIGCERDPGAARCSQALRDGARLRGDRRARRQPHPRPRSVRAATRARGAGREPRGERLARARANRRSSPRSCAIVATRALEPGRLPRFRRREGLRGTGRAGRIPRRSIARASRLRFGGAPIAAVLGTKLLRRREHARAPRAAAAFRRADAARDVGAVDPRVGRGRRRAGRDVPRHGAGRDVARGARQGEQRQHGVGAGRGPSRRGCARRSRARGRRGDGAARAPRGARRCASPTAAAGAPSKRFAVATSRRSTTALRGARGRGPHRAARAARNGAEETFVGIVGKAPLGSRARVALRGNRVAPRRRAAAQALEVFLDCATHARAARGREGRADRIHRRHGVRARGARARAARRWASPCSARRAAASTWRSRRPRAAWRASTAPTSRCCRAPRSRRSWARAANRRRASTSTASRGVADEEIKLGIVPT